MRADVKPFDDERVRLALKLVQNRQQILDLALGDTGFLGTDDFVAPGVDPASAPIHPPAQDIARAKQLLAEAGLPDGFQTEFQYPAAPEWIGTASQVYAQQAREIGVEIKLVPMPADAYYAKWTEWAFGATHWSHRPLATMLMGLALRPGAAWNETRWNDKTFEGLLDEAIGTHRRGRPAKGLRAAAALRSRARHLWRAHVHLCPGRADAEGAELQADRLPLRRVHRRLDGPGSPDSAPRDDAPMLRALRRSR